MEEVEEIEAIRCNVKCPNSLPGDPHTLSYRTGAKRCYDCNNHSNLYYHCNTCVVDFEQGCLYSFKNITHPYHLQHPLTFTCLNTPFIISNLIQIESPSIFDKCSWCGDNPDTCVYSCSICSFALCFPCSENIPLLTIPNPKSHHHPLSFLPRPLLGPCDACGLVRAYAASYACLQCNYVVHERCMALPRVIKLTRHPHRLFLGPFLPPAMVVCRVCYKGVDIRYGQYSCHHEDCSYVIHSRCAIHYEVWDGRELEWEPEDDDREEDVASFTKVDGTDDLIDYIFHDHYLQLVEYDADLDANKQCEACVLPIDDFSRFYNCIECDDYSLHEVCAGLPKELDHVLHKHRLFLDPTPQDDYESMTCTSCDRKSNGFRYKCIEDDCDCHMDLRCILVPHHFTHKSHQHPLFSSVSDVRGSEVTCYICHEECRTARLLCTLCEFAMCYRCATIPTELLYKYDEHPLSLCYGENADTGIYWCEVCESKIDKGKWFYTCDKCCVTIHRECLFGSSAYMKCGSTFSLKDCIVKVISNVGVTRLVCGTCEDRCLYPVSYTLPYEEDMSEKAICSFRCLQGAFYHLFGEDR